MRATNSPLPEDSAKGFVRALTPRTGRGARQPAIGVRPNRRLPFVSVATPGAAVNDKESRAGSKNSVFSLCENRGIVNSRMDGLVRAFRRPSSRYDESWAGDLENRKEWQNFDLPG